jgi:hypothetical protein
MGILKRGPRTGPIKAPFGKSRHRYDEKNDYEVRDQYTEYCHDPEDDYSDRSDEEYMRLHEPEPEPDDFEPDNPDAGSPPPRRLLGQGAAPRPSEEPATTVVKDSGETKESAPSPDRGTVRLTVGISKELHIRLRIHAIRAGQLPAQVIAGWIREHTEG